jgi:retron-type reverse transcriptase
LGHKNSVTRDDIFRAWQKFKKGKMKKQDVLAFSMNAEIHLHRLWGSIADKTYRHGTYTTFSIRDPKLRVINKATVHDRIIHHAVFMKLEPLFEKGFIYDSYASRKGKGSLKMLKQFESFARKISYDNRRAVWVLKCDIRKFFDSVDHEILKLRILRKISDRQILVIIDEILKSFCTKSGKGIPLGNITNQIFANVYLDPLDHFIKRNLKVSYYLRYADDIVLIANNKEILLAHLEKIKAFLKDYLELELHPNKISLHTWRQGVDILGYISYPNYRKVRTKTKHRIRKNIVSKKRLFEQGIITKETLDQTFASYKGRIKHCWSQDLAKTLGLC